MGFFLLLLVLPSKSFQEFVRLLGLKGKGAPEMSRFWMRWLSRFINRKDTSPPSRRSSCRDMSAACWSQTFKQNLSSRETLTQCTCKAPLHTLPANPDLQSMGRALLVARVRQNQARQSRSSCEAITLSSAQQQQGNWCKAGISKKKEPQTLTHYRHISETNWKGENRSRFVLSG